MASEDKVLVEDLLSKVSVEKLREFIITHTKYNALQDERLAGIKDKSSLAAEKDSERLVDYLDKHLISIVFPPSIKAFISKTSTFTVASFVQDALITKSPNPRSLISV